MYLKKKKIKSAKYFSLVRNKEKKPPCAFFPQRKILILQTSSKLRKLQQVCNLTLQMNNIKNTFPCSNTFPNSRFEVVVFKNLRKYPLSKCYKSESNRKH